MARTRVNIISGFLGVGKTTAVNRLLTERPEGERWAVVVNEFGDTGVDGALYGSATTVREIPGGCICCTAGLQFHDALVRLIRDERPDRVLIEPSGIATVASLVDGLRAPGMRDAVRPGPVVTLVDPAHWVSPRHRRNETYRDQIDGADILLANRTDLCPPAATATFLREAAELFPPKLRVDTVTRGAIPTELLEWPTAVDDGAHPGLVLRRPAVIHRHHEEFFTVGATLPRDQRFDESRLAAWVRDLRSREGFARLKGVFHTTGGWLAWNATTAEATVSASGHRRDSRVELVLSRDAASPQTRRDRPPENPEALDDWLARELARLTVASDTSTDGEPGRSR